MPQERKTSHQTPCLPPEIRRQALLFSHLLFSTNGFLGIVIAKFGAFLFVFVCL